MSNQYFRLFFRGTKAYIRFYPAGKHGLKLNIREVTGYLEHNHYKNYPIKELNAAIEQNIECECCIGNWDGFEVREQMSIDVSWDKMSVTARFYPPSDGGEVLDAKNIVELLIQKRIKYGIRPAIIYRFLKNPVYCTDFVIAAGKDVVSGKDARIEYLFNTDPNLQPKRNADGSVNYKELNTINHVGAGDILARLIPEECGEEGINVFGERIQPGKVAHKHLSFGKNITMNEDGTEIRSDVSGHVVLYHGKVFVSNTYTVPADVDNSTGNITYDGNVHIMGTVRTGFSVEAAGDIIVEGIVENASLRAKGQIIVKHGVHGGGGGLLCSESNVLAKYIDNAKVIAGGYIEADTIMVSDVSAGGSIRVFGKKGLISGGSVRAKTFIEVANMGSSMGTPTLAEVGIEPERKQHLLDLCKLIRQKQKDLDDMQIIIMNYGGMVQRGEHVPKDKLEYAQNLAELFKTGQKELGILTEEMELIQEELSETDKSYILVANTAFAGVTIGVGELSLHLKETRYHTRFCKAAGEIRADIY